MEPLTSAEAYKCAKDPRSNGKTLAILSHSNDVNIRELVAANPSTPPLVFEELANDLLTVKRSLAGNIHLCDPYTSQLIIQNDDIHLILALVNNPSLTAWHMEELDRKFSYVGALLISNASCPLDILRSTYLDMQEIGTHDVGIAAKLKMCKDFIENPCTPLEILAKLFIAYPPYRGKILENVRVNYPMFDGASDQELARSLTRQVTPIY